MSQEQPQPVKGFSSVVVGTTVIGFYLDHTEAETIAASHPTARVHRQEGYAPAAIQPTCACGGNPLRASICPYGHILECHYPYTCEEAACGHTLSYEEQEAERREAEVEEILATHTPVTLSEVEIEAILNARR